MAILFTLRVFARNLLRKSPKKYFSSFVLMSGLGLANPDFTSNKPTHFQLDYGDTAQAILYILLYSFDDMIIPRVSAVNYTARSCNLASLDFFVMDFLKSLLYANKPR